MRWLLREGALVTALAALAVALEASWLSMAIHAWLAILSGLVLVATWLSVRATFPDEQLRDQAPGVARGVRSVEQVSDFALAVEYQLRDFLRARLREIAALRLSGHGIDLSQDPEGARSLLGDAAWQAVGPGDVGDSSLTLLLLEDAVTRLEALEL